MRNLDESAAYTHGGIFWVLFGPMALAGALLALLDLSEFWKVAFSQEAISYPWGPVNENPWYYQTAATYSSYCLVNGLLYLLATFVLLGAAVAKNQRLATLASMAVVGCLLANLLSAAIQ